LLQKGAEDADCLSVRHDGVEFGAALTAARRGHPWGHGYLVRLVADRLLGYLRAQGAVDPDGLANDVLVQVLTGLERFKGDESGFTSWVFTIARCRLIDERRARRRRVDTQPLDAQCFDLVGGDVHDDVMAALGGDWVDATLQSLPPDQRDVLLLRVVSDLSIDETAAVLGKTSGAVKALQHRAVAAIRRKISAEAVSL
jgi:RNA polymerase sigma factor (sigma-70 family)